MCLLDIARPKNNRRGIRESSGERRIGPERQADTFCPYSRNFADCSTHVIQKLLVSRRIKRRKRCFFIPENNP